MMGSAAKKHGIGAIVLASVLWGTTGTAASFTQNVSPLATGAFATGVGGLFLLFYSYRTLLSDSPLLLANSRLLLLGGAAVVVYPLAFYTAMNWSGVAIGTVVSIASAPFFTVLLECLISKKRVSVNWVVSFVLGVLGICCLIIGKPDQASGVLKDTLYVWGLLLGLLAGLTYAIYSWVAKALIDKGVQSQSSVASMFGLASLVLIPSLYFTGENLFLNSTHVSIAFYMAIFPMFLGYLLFGIGLRTIEASQATLITLLEPAVATLFAVWIVGERLTLLGWGGMIAIVFCLILQLMPSKSAIETIKLTG
ncbi:EamA family transporter [Vibrio sp. 10N.261.55.A7]|uniref:DMT family transporter n=1 Tax=Vibrio sp. 10N.261.55.A7 TaxID=1880851 RepID=UPI000C830842|nr:EamA family transporter [Vibrio sp. 10N.261.55.A7]PMK01442.1 hypothetical protein BCU12_19150 [Vibrio sp. 10N.261.55.A7]